MKQTNFDAKRRPCLSALLAVLLAWPLGLAAQDGVEDEAQAIDDAADFEATPSWYLGVLGGYVVPDSARDAEQGINLHGILGIVLADSLALELNIFGQQMERTSDGRNDYSNGGGLDLVLGTPAPGNPFFMIGGGSIHEDLRTTKRRGEAVAGYEDNSPYANAGLGLYLPFSMAGELWRLEGRYNVVFNDETERSDDFFEDVRINLGVVFPFSREQPPSPPIELPPPPPPPVPPPPPTADADEDGVADELDQCPGTPRWVRADAAGCTPDSDGDGVDETRDCCPNTPAGTAVDGQGCEPLPPPAATLLAPPPDTDTDNDGVVDRLDVCPHTVTGYEVDASGCVKIQNVVIKSVHFELDSDALTQDAYLVLNSVAASFKAQPRIVVEVAGHADSIGSSGYNMALSQRRAAVVRDFLIFSGVPPQQLVSAGYSETRPLGDNRTEAGRALNRRVEFRMLDK